MNTNAIEKTVAPEDRVNVIKEHGVLVHVGIHLISGSAKLFEEDLDLPDGFTLPDGKVFSLGRKYFVPPATMKRANNFRTKATALCSSKGTKFSGAYLWSLKDAQELVKGLEALKEEFYDFKDNVFVPNYPQWVEDWANQYPTIKDRLLDAAASVERIEEFMQFEYTLISIGVPEGELGDAFRSSALSLSDRLYKEVADDIRSYLVHSVQKKGRNANDGLSQKARSPIMSARGKLESLSFFDPAIMNVVSYIDDVLETLPKAGYMKGDDFNRLMSLLVSLSTKDSIKLLSEGMSAQPTAATTQPAVAAGQVSAPSGIHVKGSGDDFNSLARFNPMAVPGGMENIVPFSKPSPAEIPASPAQKQESEEEIEAGFPYQNGAGQEEVEDFQMPTLF